MLKGSYERSGKSWPLPKNVGTVKLVVDVEYDDETKAELHITVSGDGVVMDLVDHARGPGSDVVGSTWETFSQVVERLSPP